MLMLSGRACSRCRQKEALYGLPEDTKATKCGDCRTEQMINLRSKKCEVCREHVAIYGDEMGKPTRCGKHRDPQMENVFNIRCKSCGFYRAHKETDYLCEFCRCHSPPCLLYSGL